MGYESKIYIVEKSSIIDIIENEQMFYAKKIAMFNLGKSEYSNIYKIIEKSKDSDCYIFADDGNTKIFEDKYKQRLKEINKQDLIDILIKDIEETERNYKNLLYSYKLKAFLNYLLNLNDDYFIKILHYGY